MISENRPPDTGGSAAEHPHAPRINLPAEASADSSTKNDHSTPKRTTPKQHHRWLWSAVVIAGLLVAFLGVSIVLANTTSANEIAKGTTIEGVNVGGMTTADAAKTLDSANISANQQPVTVNWNNKTYTFDPSQAGVKVDSQASADAALKATSGENFLTRTVDMYFGQDVAPQYTHSADAVTHFVQGLPQDRSAAPQNATITGTPGQTLSVTKSHDQTGLDQKGLESAINAELANPGDRSPITAQTGVVAKASVTTDQLQKDVDGANFLYVDQTTAGPLNHQSVSLYQNGKYVESFPVATGQPAWPTQSRLTKIESHTTCPVWTQPNSAWTSNPGAKTPGCAPNNPLGKYWMGIGDGEGFHVSPVNVRSHGCIHMNEADIAKLFNEVPNATPVYVGQL